MKELSIEEKAKRYDEAIIRAKSLIGDTIIEESGQHIAEVIFPELKESEDERIRKDIIVLVKDWWDRVNKDNISTKEQMIAWLEKQGQTFTKKDVDDAYLKGVCDTKHEFEKQGEQKSADKVEPKFKIGDTIRNKITNEVFTIISRCISLEYYCDINHSHEVKFSEQDNWELVEQKPADKVERKFKVGDWIVNQHGTVRHIKEVDNAGYQTDKGWLTHENYEKNFHLWTIQDAKDGDVLATDDDICIFDGTLEEGKYPFAYCGITKRGFDSYDVRLPFSHDNNIHPATKEQRDLLFQKMKEAGYEWDVEKKELKKIELIQEEVTEFEKAVKQVMEEAIECDDTHNLKADADMLLRLAQKPWNEEDERIIDGLISICDEAQDNIPRLSVRFSHVEALKKWLTSLKDRVQPKQEWSEEDNVMLISIENILIGRGHSFHDKEIDWLKSLRHRSQWKPSDEQMGALWSATEKYLESDNENVRKLRGEVLESLYEQLKKLKGE